MTVFDRIFFVIIFFTPNAKRNGAVLDTVFVSLLLFTYVSSFNHSPFWDTIACRKEAYSHVLVVSG
jgi:hypothetical protein